jgi:16S rRNA (guanine527-N7)-methyltransferase
MDNCCRFPGVRHGPVEGHACMGDLHIRGLQRTLRLSICKPYDLDSTLANLADANTRSSRPDSMKIQEPIAKGVRRMGFDFTDVTVERLAAFVSLLERWNKVYNLTAVRRPEDMVKRHILDSLAILPWLRGPCIVDVGSGAGLPGIPLAIVRPEIAFSLLDSSGKRTRFMRQAVADLHLSNVNVIRSRVEEYRPGVAFDSVLSRAFGSLAAMLAQAGGLCAPSGRLLAMKGKYPENELRNLPRGYKVVEVIPLPIPTLAAERHLIHLVPNNFDNQAER